jgi:hypothetical protein
MINKIKIISIKSLEYKKYSFSDLEVFLINKNFILQFYNFYFF